MQRKITIAPGEYYHIYNRGVEKRNIFISKDDHERFMRLLYLSNSTKPYVYRLVQGLPLNEIDLGEKRVAIGAYSLMPNHFHLLVREIEDGGISGFMEKLTTGYSMYFNKRNKRVGSLFQGTFKAEHVDTDEYLKYLYAYIHLNPVKLIEPTWKEKGIQNLTRAKKYLESYRYTSYVDYALGKREESAILSPKEFPGYFEKKKDFARFVDEWLDYREEHIEQEA